MEVLNTLEQSVYKNKRVNSEKKQFEQLWSNSISGEEFVLRTHELLKDLYAIQRHHIFLNIKRGCNM